MKKSAKATTGIETLTAKDYYPFGMEMPGRVRGSDYRFGYQGQFAEKDEETGYNQFEARLFDNRIGRWISTDPARQFWSPYLGMGNNPIRGVDPNGETVWYFISEHGAYGGFALLNFVPYWQQTGIAKDNFGFTVYKASTTLQISLGGNGTNIVGASADIIDGGVMWDSRSNNFANSYFFGKPTIVSLFLVDIGSDDYYDFNVYTSGYSFGSSIATLIPENVNAFSFSGSEMLRLNKMAFFYYDRPLKESDLGIQEGYLVFKTKLNNIVLDIPMMLNEVYSGEDQKYYQSLDYLEQGDIK